MLLEKLISLQVNESEKRNKRMKKLLNLIMIFGITAFLISSCEKKEESKNVKVTVSDTIAVQTANVEKINLQVAKYFSGNLEGEEQANIVAKIPERIVAIKVMVGDNVTAGQTLIILDKAGASSQYYQAEAGFLNASKDLDRMKALFAEGAISQQMLDGIQTQFNIAKANFEAAKSTVELTSPISGVITSLDVSIGDLATPGIPLSTVASIGKMKIIFNAGESDIPNLAVGQSVEVSSELKPNVVQKGSINQISKSADISSRSFEVKALFNNVSDRWFKPGMFAKAKIDLHSSKGSLTVNNSSIVISGEEKGVYIIQNKIAFYKKVLTGLSDGKLTEILNGLTESDEVVTIGANNLKDGSPVHIAK
jgi:membrane fusion protein, multidrug efflux system